MIFLSFFLCNWYFFNFSYVLCVSLLTKPLLKHIVFNIMELYSTVIQVRDNLIKHVFKVVFHSLDMLKPLILPFYNGLLGVFRYLLNWFLKSRLVASCMTVLLSLFNLHSSNSFGWQTRSFLFSLLHNWFVWTRIYHIVTT